MPQVEKRLVDSDAIKARRLRLGLSRAQLAEKTGRSRETIRNLERGAQKYASLLLLNQLANALDGTPDEFSKDELAA
jgi:transcriptional regulator with XRE-family HTH domain